MYPDNWAVEPLVPAEEGWSVAVQSSGPAFFMVTVHADRPAVADVLQAAVAALREDYPALELEDAEETLAGRRTTGHDVRFISMDFVATCRLRCWQTNDRTVLVLCQASDLDDEHAEAVLAAMRASLRVERA